VALVALRRLMLRLLGSRGSCLPRLASLSVAAPLALLPQAAEAAALAAWAQ